MAILGLAAFVTEILASIYKVLINAWLIISATRNANALLRASSFLPNVPTLPIPNGFEDRIEMLAQVAQDFATFMKIPWFANIVITQ